MNSLLASRVVNFRKPPDFNWHLGVVAKRVYRFENGLCVPHETQLPLTRSAQAEVDGPDARDKDDYPFKPLTDVVLHGAVHAGREVTELTAALKVGPVSRNARVHGDRRVTEVSGGVATAFSAAAPFSSMPLSHTRSYGGFDAYAAAKLGDEAAAMSAAFGLDFAAASRFTYPRNARGMGFFVAIDPERVIGAAVPNVEDPEDPVLPARLLCASAERWFEQPIPGALDFLQFVDFPRSLFFNVDPELPSPPPPLRELALGAIELGDLSPRHMFQPPTARAANGAAPGLARVRLRGDEPVQMINLHRAHRDLAFRLPGEIPELRIQPPGCPILELEPVLDTIYLEPEADRVSLIWSGSVQVASRYPPDDLAAVEHFVRWP